MKDILIKLIVNAVVDFSVKEKFAIIWDYKDVEKWLLEQEEYKELINETNDFEKIIKLLHESTHDKEIREKLLSIYEFKEKTLK